MPFKRSDAGIVVAMLAIARRTEVAEFVSESLDFARKRFYRVTGNEHVSALSCLLDFDTADRLSMLGKPLFDSRGRVRDA